MTTRKRLPVFAAVLGVLLLAGCVTETPERADETERAPGSLMPEGTPTVLASGLDAPWSILRLGDSDSTLISERDSAEIKELTPTGTLRVAAKVQGVSPGGEGGLLGITSLKEGGTTWVYAYFTSSSDNRIVRMPLTGAAGSYGLGKAEPILSGLAKAGNHNGGRIKFGPDGMLYATVGDAGSPDRAQDQGSLNGKILRMTPTGMVPKGNPFPGSLVWSMGHRNPQGIAWDSKGQLWAAEFGQNTWDEFNRIVAGANYGWPTVEGISNELDARDFENPGYQWSTAEASPSGLAYVGGTFFMAALRGERLWALYPSNTVHANSYFDGVYGRIRDAVAGPGGTLWILTNNTDGRGSPKQGDDKLIQVKLAPVPAG